MAWSPEKSAQKTLFMAAVHAHLAEHGFKNWKILLDRFPNISTSHKWALIAEAKKIAASEAELAAATEKVRKLNMPISDREIEAAQLGALGISRHLPAAPSPAYLSRSGGVGMENLDFLVEIPKLYADAQMLRASAIKVVTRPDGTTEEKIQNPASFDRSILRRASIIEGAIRAVQEVWDLKQQQEFFTAIIEEIGKESPKVQQAIMERLAALNSRMGMTMARV